MDIVGCFKACGVYNDMDGGESHLIQCQNLLSYEAPQSKDDVPQKQPYSSEQVSNFIDKEMKALNDKKKKRQLQKVKKRVLKLTK